MGYRCLAATLRIMYNARQGLTIHGRVLRAITRRRRAAITTISYKVHHLVSKIRGCGART